MKRFFKKRGRWAAVYAFVLAIAFTFVLLDTFVIPKSYGQTADNGANAMPIESDGGEQESSSLSAGEDVQSDTYTYRDDNITITVETVREYDTTIYIADIQLSDASLLKTALAQGTYGRNIKQTTSEMAEDNNAIFAINGDYYGFRDYGYVLRNGTLYRDTAGDGDALVIGSDGSFSIAAETEIDSAILENAWQVLSFGPALVEDSTVVVDKNDEVSRSKTSNPRTAIGQVDALHYIVIVSDGRTSESEGLSLYQLANEFYERGATIAYNLDGGGSSTMVLNGEVLNSTTNGKSDSEREVSDIVYIGY